MTATGKLVYEETSEDHDEYFHSGGWSSAGGCIQSLSFAFHAFDAIRERLEDVRKWELRGTALHHHAVKIHDYGCALGDGTAFLQACFPLARVKGFDFSPQAVEMAWRRWPTLDFQVGDVNAPSEDAFFIWCSHVLEHQKDAAETVKGLLKRCEWLVLIVPKIEEGGEDGGHLGAEATEKWMGRLPPPEWIGFYVVPRKVPETHQEGVGEVLFESNVLGVWKGDLG